MNKPGEEPLLSLPERHSRILSLLQQNGSISVTQLSELFKVSEVTIRKDLSYLEQQKKLYRTHGSAILISPYISDRHVNEKEKKNVAEKPTKAWTAKGTDVGEYPVGIVSGDFANTSKNFTNVVFTVADGALTISPISEKTITVTAARIAASLPAIGQMRAPQRFARRRGFFVFLLFMSFPPV